MAKKIEIELSDEAIKDLYELKKKLNPKDKTHPFYEELESYDEFYKKMKKRKNFIYKR